MTADDLVAILKDAPKTTRMVTTYTLPKAFPVMEGYGNPRVKPTRVEVCSLDNGVTEVSVYGHAVTKGNVKKSGPWMQVPYEAFQQALARI
jgi:hypothetical protein